MKFFASFAALVILAVALTGAAEQKKDHNKHHIKHHESKHHHNKHHHAKHVGKRNYNRRAEDECAWKCVDQNNNEVTADDIKNYGNFAIDIVLDASVSLSIYYNSQAQAVIFYNRSINMLLVVQKGFYALINLKEKIVLLVNVNNGNAYIAEDATFSLNTSLDILISNAITFMSNYSSKTVGFFALTNNNVFALGTLMGSLGGSFLGNLTVWGTKSSAKALYVAGYQSFFSVSSSRFNIINSLFSADVKVALVGFWGTNAEVQKTFTVIIGGYIAGNLFASTAVAVGAVFSVSTFLGGIIAGSFVNAAVSGAVLVFVAAETGVRINIALVGGAISVAGRMIGVIGSSINYAAAASAGLAGKAIGALTGVISGFGQISFGFYIGGQVTAGGAAGASGSGSGYGSSSGSGSVSGSGSGSGSVYGSGSGSGSASGSGSGYVGGYASGGYSIGK